MPHLPADRCMRFHEAGELLSMPRLASRDSASVTAETVQAARNFPNTSVSKSLKRRQLLKMQGSQIIDSKYGPIH